MSTLREAREAHARRDWPRARELFTAAAAEGELPPDDLYLLSDAAWWLGDNATLFEACERAYWKYLDADQPRRAALAATDIAAANFLAGNASVASGWISRAGRLLEEYQESPEHGYLIYILEVEGPLGGIVPSEMGAAENLIAAARRVREIGRRHAERTLIASGTLGEGRVLVKMGQVAQGLALLDEAMLAALADDLIPAWTGNIFCQLIEAAEELGDYRRALAWTDAMTHWLSKMPAAVVFSGICRVHRSRVHQLTGAWDEAEQEAARVCIELGALHVSAAAKAHYQVGEIRRLRGDFERAEAAYGEAHALGRDPQPGLALLRLAQGRTEVAASSIRTALLAETNGFRRATLRAAQVEIALSAGTLDEAREAADELHELADRYGSPGLEIATRHARGAVLLADGRAAEALPVLRDACRGWSEMNAPYECARVRLLLARVYTALGDDDGATRELQVAAAAFERLGATADLRTVAELRDERALPGGLTPREVEVLALVAAGKSNKAIGRALSLSEKTVARHLANIFTKLSVTSRTAAAAFAFEHRIAQPAADAPRPRPAE